MTTYATRADTRVATGSHPAPSGPAPVERGGAADRRIGWLLGAVVFTAAFVLSWVPSLWGDEAASILSAERPLPSLFRMLGHVDAVHGTYYLFLHFWIDAFGASPLSVRLPAAIATGVAAAGLYFVARMLTTRPVAVVAVLIFAILPRTAAFNDEARSYAFGAAIAVWLLLLLLRLVARRTLAAGWWVAYGALLCLGVYTFLYFGLFVVVHAVLLARARVGRRVWRRWALATGAAVVAASPVVFFSVAERNQVAFLAGRSTDSPFSVLVTTFFTTTSLAVVSWGLVLVAVAFGVVAEVRRRRSARRFAARGGVGGPRAGAGERELDGLTRPLLPGATLVGVVWFVGPLILLLVGNLAIADYSPRYLSYSAAGGALLMALGLARLADVAALGLHRASALGAGAGLTSLGRRSARWFVVFGVASALVLALEAPVYAATRTPNAKNNSDWQQISEVIGKHAAAGEGVVFDDTVRPSRRTRLAMETYPAGFTGLTDLTIKTPVAAGDTWHDTAYSVDQALALGRFDGVRTVWLIDYAVGGKSDDHSLAALEAAGYRVVTTYSTHRSAIVELTRG
ncbi:glycosyltransferase family 39 protein [Frondihabitans australicus]|uniref:Mannosyltransferase n=1 Tax=Frondihabitans australicus TaxID=386892 RepID=A0A495IKZ3_9MICO|nr:glycosyltransferase family 39 protein [Frondihabitans australicus]RKR76657.1 mannosyltransferase [Frondihabitans australicus]